MQYLDYFSELDLIVFYFVLLFTVLALVIPNFLSKKTTPDFVEYLLMGRKLTLPMFVTTLVATWYSAILGVTQISFEKGVYNIVTQGLFWYLAGLIFAFFLVKKARNSNALTFPELIGSIYGPKSAKLTSVIMLLNLLPVIAAISMGILLRGVFGIDLNLGVLIGAVLAGAYCLWGGFRSIVICDAIQFVLMYSAIIMVVIVSYNSFGGLEYLELNLPAKHFEAKADESWSTVFVWFFMAICWTLLSPVFYHRCFAAKDYKTAKVGIIISVCFWVVCDIFTTLGGMYARAYMGEVNPADGYLLYALKILPDGFKGLFLASMICTVFSALDSFILLASSVIYHDLPNVSKSQSQIYKAASMVLVVIATVVASSFFGDRIEIAILSLQSIFLSVLFIPILLGILFKPVVTDSQFSYLVSINLAISMLWGILGFNDYLNVFYIGSAVNLSILPILWAVNGKKREKLA